MVESKPSGWLKDAPSRLADCRRDPGQIAPARDYRLPQAFVGRLDDIEVQHSIGAQHEAQPEKVVVHPETVFFNGELGAKAEHAQSLPAYS